MQNQTSIETARGISSVASLPGQSLVVVSGIGEEGDRHELLNALRVLKDGDISIDFLKVAHHGFSFVLPQEAADTAVSLLCGADYKAKAMHDRTVIEVAAPNIRDESGLVARIAQLVSQSGATIEHVGDMHSSVQVVVESDRADAAVELLNAHVGLREIV